MECETSGNNEVAISTESSSVLSRSLQAEPAGKSTAENMSETSFGENSSELKTPSDKQCNRRCTYRPRKYISKDIGSNLKKLMKKKIHKEQTFLIQQNLETIFEEPIFTDKEDLVLIGLSKAKRSISFSQFVTKTKLKTSKVKAKKLREQLAERKKMEDVEKKLWKLGL